MLERSFFVQVGDLLVYFRMSWKCSRNVLKMFQKCSGNVLGMFWKCSRTFQNISRTFAEHFQNISKTFPGHFQNIFRTFPKHFQNISRTFLEHLQNITNNIEIKVWINDVQFIQFSVMLNFSQFGGFGQHFGIIICQIFHIFSCDMQLCNSYFPSVCE